MEIGIPFDGVIERIEFPDGTDILEAKYHPTLTLDSVTLEIKREWEKRREIFRNKKISIIVNDGTRRVPTSAIIKMLSRFVGGAQMEILIATGTHRRPTNPELNEILGDLRDQYDGKIFIHDCYDTKSMTRIGTTSRGTPVTVNKKLMEAESLVCINSVEPHFFAGYTGGRKSLVPGLASFETIVANHSHAKSEFADSLNLDNNPVHLDLEEAADLAAVMPIFSIQLVLSRNGEIVDLHCRHLKDSFRKACEKAYEVYSIPIKKAYDVVFAIGEPPLDASLYQLQKGQEHGARAVADGGILVVVGACREGAGSPYFVKLADDYPTPEDALTSRAMADGRFGIHKLIKTARRLKKIKIWYLTKMDDNAIIKLYFEPKNSLRESLQEAVGYFGGACEVAVLKDACFMVPVRV